MRSSLAVISARQIAARDRIGHLPRQRTDRRRWGPEALDCARASGTRRFGGSAGSVPSSPIRAGLPCRRRRGTRCFRGRCATAVPSATKRRCIIPGPGASSGRCR